MAAVDHSLESLDIFNRMIGYTDSVFKYESELIDSNLAKRGGVVLGFFIIAGVILAFLCFRFGGKKFESQWICLKISSIFSNVRAASRGQDASSSGNQWHELSTADDEDLTAPDDIEKSGENLIHFVKVQTHREKVAEATADEDEYIARIKRTGCFPEHEAMQDCYYESKDWRRCREEMKRFRECFARHEKTRE
ncbi:hypothetical protein HDU67_009707 [Dinochytrium kinnereticum]|nr:hypothetical protein HDU67_009707 [Dinochytrium kinnereticum]